MERVGHLIGLDYGELQEVIGRDSGQRRVLLGRQIAESMPGLRCDHDACTSSSDHLAELLEHDGGSVQVDCEDARRRGLAG
jgi:hypothetical protein